MWQSHQTSYVEPFFGKFKKVSKDLNLFINLSGDREVGLAHPLFGFKPIQFESMQVRPVLNLVSQFWRPSTLVVVGLKRFPIDTFNRVVCSLAIMRKLKL